MLFFVRLLDLASVQHVVFIIITHGIMLNGYLSALYGKMLFLYIFSCFCDLFPRFFDIFINYITTSSYGKFIFPKSTKHFSITELQN